MTAATAAITFDTLAYSKKLKKIGVPDRQAEAQTEIMADMMTETIAKQFATKQDLLTTKQELQMEISSLRTEFKLDIANQTIKIGAMLAGSVALMLTLLPIILKLTNLV